MVCLLEFRLAEFTRTIWLRRKVGKSSRVLARLSAALGSRLRLLALGKGVQDLLRRLGREILIEVVPDSHHRRIAAGTLALDLNDGKLAVLGGLTGVDTAELTAHGVQDLCRPPEHTRCCRANLDKVCTDRLTVEHGVEGGDLVNAHSWHLQQLRDVVHDANTCPALVLALAEVEQGNDGGFLVLGRVPCNDLLGTLHVFGVEFEGDLGVVVLRVPVHEESIRPPGRGGRQEPSLR